MVVRNRTSGLPPDVARYEERGQVLSGERGDIRDHAIRTSYAFSIEGRRQILSTLGIPSDEFGRPSVTKLFSSNVYDELDYNINRYDDIWRTAARYTPGAGEGFARRFGNTRFLPGLISIDVWLDEIGRNFLFVGRTPEGFIQERSLGTTRTLLFPNNNFPQSLSVESDIPGPGEDLTVGDDLAFAIVPIVGAETRPGDQMSLFAMVGTSNFFSTGVAADSVYFSFARYLNPWLLAPTVLPPVIQSPEMYVPFNGSDVIRRFLLDEDTGTYDADVLRDVQDLGIPFEYAYPVVRPVFGCSPELERGRLFDLFILTTYRR